LGHSGKGNDVYGDTTGYMGVSMLPVQRRCYNAAQHWSLNWFFNHRIEIDSSITSTTVELAAFVDVGKTQSLPVLARLAGTNVYFQYNRAKDHNSDTDIYRNAVVIVVDLGARTDLLAGLATVGAQYQTDTGIVVELCNLTTDQDVDTATVGVGSSSASSASLCNADPPAQARVPAPVSAPISRAPVPTMFPIRAPTTFAPATAFPIRIPTTVAPASVAPWQSQWTRNPVVPKTDPPVMNITWVVTVTNTGDDNKNNNTNKTDDDVPIENFPLDPNNDDVKDDGGNSTVPDSTGKDDEGTNDDTTGRDDGTNDLPGRSSKNKRNTTVVVVSVVGAACAAILIAAAVSLYRERPRASERFDHIDNMTKTLVPSGSINGSARTVFLLPSSASQPSSSLPSSLRMRNEEDDEEQSNALDSNGNSMVSSTSFNWV
jgi:hypothetical protein